MWYSSSSRTLLTEAPGTLTTPGDLERDLAKTRQQQGIELAETDLTWFRQLEAEG